MGNITKSYEFGVRSYELKVKNETKTFEAFWTVILNPFQDLTPWTKLDAEPSSA
jgi:hypothetical protein